MSSRPYVTRIKSNSTGYIDEHLRLSWSKSGAMLNVSINLSFANSGSMLYDSTNLAYTWSMRLKRVDAQGRHSTIASRTGWVSKESPSHREFSLSGLSGADLYVEVILTQGVYADGIVWTQPTSPQRIIQSYRFTG